MCEAGRRRPAGATRSQRPGHLPRVTETVPAAGVVHVRYATRPGELWRGRSPLWFAEDSRALAAALELRLGQELAGPVGQIDSAATGCRRRGRRW